MVNDPQSGAPLPPLEYTLRYGQCPQCGVLTYDEDELNGHNCFECGNLVNWELDRQEGWSKDSVEAHLAAVKKELQSILDQYPEGYHLTEMNFAAELSLTLSDIRSLIRQMERVGNNINTDSEERIR
jgi:hypothetical protein